MSAASPATLLLANALAVTPEDAALERWREVFTRLNLAHRRSVRLRHELHQADAECLALAEELRAAEAEVRAAEARRVP